MTSVMVVKICHVWGLNESKISTLRAFRCLKFPGRSVHWLAAIALWPFDTRCEFSAGDFHGPKSLQIGKTWDLEIFKSRILDSEEHNSRIFLKYVFSYCEMARYIYIYKSSSRYLPEKKYIHVHFYWYIYFLGECDSFIFPVKKLGVRFCFPKIILSGGQFLEWSEVTADMPWDFFSGRKTENETHLLWWFAKLKMGGGIFFCWKNFWERFWSWRAIYYQFFGGFQLLNLQGWWLGGCF